MSCLTLQARWVLPVDQGPLEGGRVAIRDGRIVSVGPPLGRTASANLNAVHDLGDVILLPGLVNTHTHLEFSQLKETLGQPGLPLPDWIRLVLRDRKRSLRDPAQAILAGLKESLRGGVTTLGEIATSPAAIYRQVSPLPFLTLFDEVIGFSQARVDSVLEATRARWTTNLEDHPLASSPIECSLGLSPHAPYTVHPCLLQKLIDMAIAQQLPVAMHLAESAEELQLLAQGNGPFQQLLDERSMWDVRAISRNTEPMDYLQQLARAPRCLVVHGNFLKSQEFEFIAQRRDRMTVIYCPRTHDYFGHPSYPLAEMLAAGVQIALGTDSLASNPDLSLLSEMREVTHKHQGISTEQIVHLGTLAGAQALGLEKCAGSITPGKWANLTAIPCDRSCRDPHAEVVKGQAVPVATWLRGEKVFSR